jgi:hypothetical protein
MKAAVRNAAELGVGDVVRTPTQRLATVTGFNGDYVLLVYLADDGTSDENDAVTLWPGYVSLVRKAAPHELPRGFFGRSGKAQVNS